MSRRKQLRPKRLVSLNSVDHVCSRCCAEFNAPSDLEQHQRVCSPNPPVLILNEDEDLLSGSKTFSASLPASPVGEPGETVHDVEMENINTSDRSYRSAEFMDCFRCRGSSSSNHSTECKTDTVLCTSGFPEFSPDLTTTCSATQEGYSWMKSNVIIENLERTKVAMAQLSQLTCSDSCHSQAAILSLLQQLLALQIQQIHQLQLIDQIRHQVLLFASHQAESPETLVIYTKDPPSSKSTNQLKALSAHLSQQLAAAAGVAKCLSTQSANIKGFKHFTATEQLSQSQPDGSSESSVTFSKFRTTAVHEHVSNQQPSDLQLNFLSQTKMSSLMFSKNCFISKTSENSHLLQPSSGSEHTASDLIPNISEIVEDLDALAALAQQSKHKNLKLSAPARSSKESLFKRKCRCCAKVFGSDSALQIHLRSHTGERPYKCNVCGNRFSTGGNLKVHSKRHKETFLHIQKNPYLVPEQLGKIQTSAGIPFGSGLSLSTEKAAARWFAKLPSPTTITSGSLERSDSTNRSSLKKEHNFISLAQGDLYFNSAACMDYRSKANPAKTSDSVEIGQQRTIHVKTEDVKPSLSCVSTGMTTKCEESGHVIPNTFTLPSSTLFSGFLSIKHSNSPELQLLSVTTDKSQSDPHECVICHRILSCQSALKMHYRTHTGERPYQCKLCRRAFTTKGNLKTHQAVHRATVPLRVQQHAYMHMKRQSPSEDPTNQKHSVRCNEGFGDKAKLNQNNFSDGNNGGSDTGLSRFKSLSIHLSPSSFGKNLIDANKNASYYGSHGELQLQWIKTEKPEGSNAECSQTNSQQAAAESGKYAGTFPMSESSASEQFLSPVGQHSMYLKSARLDEPFQTCLDSTTLTLCASAPAPTHLKFINHTEDSPGLIHNLREKVILKNTFCDICGKSFACQSALDIHYRSHTKERPFICTTCNRGFSTKGNLKQHMLTHQMRDFPPHLFEPSNPNRAPNHDGPVLSVGSQAVKTEMTALLNSSFENGKELSGHSQSSSLCAAAPPRRTPRQHHCKTCGKSFSSSSALQIHERTHTGERPFACAVCGRAFTTKGNLKVHMGTHMWTSAPSRRGLRLTVDRSSLGLGTRPVKLPEPPQKNPEMVWNQTPAGLKVNDVRVFQSAGLSFIFRHEGLKKTPAERVCVNKPHRTDHRDFTGVKRHSADSMEN